MSQANYASAKGGIISLVRSAALGLHKYGVTANAVAPVARITHLVTDRSAPEEVLKPFREAGIEVITA